MSLTRYHPCKETELKEKTQGKRYLKETKVCIYTLSAIEICRWYCVVDELC